MIEPQVTPDAADPGSAPVLETAHAAYRRLRQAGFEAREAGSLVARVSGLAMVPGGWAVEEVERLLFVRELVRTGRIGS